MGFRILLSQHGQKSTEHYFYLKPCNFEKDTGDKKPQQTKP
jgi:hypothetical protein